MLNLTGVFLTGLVNGYGQCGLSCLSQVGPYLVAQGTEPSRAMGLAGRYLVGKTIAYAALGAIAGTLGSGLEEQLSGAGRYLLVAALFLAAVQALRPVKKTCRKTGGKGFFFWGLASGLVPCPTLLGLFALAAQTGTASDGALLGLVYGLALFLSPVLWASGLAGGVGHRLAKVQTQVLPWLRIAAAIALAGAGVQLILWEQ